jgi:hypothetical protein
MRKSDKVLPMLGWTATRLVHELPKLSPNIASISLTTYVPAPALAMRLAQAEPADADPSAFVQEALRHRGYSDPVVDVPCNRLDLALSSSPPAGEVRGVCSRVKLTNGAVAQLALLDFQCEVREANADALVVAMRKLGQKRGALLMSGRSYHYYGYDPIDRANWNQFMFRAVLLNPFVDVRYVAHCLIEGLACLRLDSATTHPSEPTIVRLIG